MSRLIGTDYNGHMKRSRYGSVVDAATACDENESGAECGLHQKSGLSLFLTADTHTSSAMKCHAGDKRKTVVTHHLLRVQVKSLRLVP